MQSAAQSMSRIERLPVVRRRNACDLPELSQESPEVIETDLQRYLRDRLVAPSYQFLCLFDPEKYCELERRHPHVMGEETAEVILAHIRLLSKRIERDLFR